MAELIDTSVFVALERRGYRPDQLHDDSAQPIALASITASELLAGVHRANTERRRARREAFVETILRLVPVLPFDVIVARTHARIWMDLAARGELIGAHDLLIAATALAHGYGILTMNNREFARVPGLVVRQSQF